MGEVVVLGERHRVAGYWDAGAVVTVAEDAAAVRRAWAALGPEVTLVVLTAAAAEVLAPETHTVAGRLVAVMPP